MSVGKADNLNGTGQVMIVLGNILISNSHNDGGVIGGTYGPAHTGDDGQDVAAILELITAGGQIILEGDAAILLFTYYETSGTHLSGARCPYLPISRQAVQSLQEEMYDESDRPKTFAIVKALAALL
jgi:hypothetical protein